MTTDGDAQSDEVVPNDGRNDLLRLARLRTPSPSDSTRPMSQRELAEAVTAYVFRTTTRDVALDRHYISRLERGRSRWPIADYRDAFRAVLGVTTDAELGFYIKKPRRSSPRRAPSMPMMAAGDQRLAQPIDVDASTVQFVLSPGTAIVLVPVNRATLSAFVPAMVST